MTKTSTESWFQKNFAWRFGKSKPIAPIIEKPKQHTGIYPEGAYPRGAGYVGETGFPRSERKALLPAWYYMTEYGQPRGLYVDELKALAKTPTPWMCISRLLDDVMSTAWEVVPIIEEGKTKPSSDAIAHANLIRNWFMNPNQNRESWMQISGQMVADVLELDSGVFTKEYASGSSHQMVQLWARDGARFLKEVDQYGVLGVPHDVPFRQQTIKNYRVGYYQHSYIGDAPVAFEPHEIVYFLQRPDTRVGRHGLYGTAPMEIVSLLVRALMKGEEWIEEYFTQGATGSLGINVEVASATSPSGLMDDAEWERWTERLEQQLKARYIKNVYLDGKTSFVPLGRSPHDIQWLETKEEYRHLVMAVYKCTSEVLGFTRDIPKSVAESQRDLYVQYGLKPLLDLIEYHANMEVVSEFFWKEPVEHGVFQHGHIGKFAGKPMDVMFRYKLYDPIAEQKQLAIDEQQLKNGLTTVNEIRARKGLDSLPWGDINPLFLLNPQQFAQSLYFGAYGHEQLEQFTRIPKPPEGVDLDAVRRAITEQAKPVALERTDPWLGYKKSRLLRTSQKLYDVSPKQTYEQLLKQDLEQVLGTVFFTKAEKSPSAFEHVSQVIDLLIAKLKTGRFVEEVLEEWFRNDLVKTFIFNVIDTEHGFKIQQALRDYFRRVPEEYTHG